MQFEAAIEGGVTSLLRVFQEDPLILDRVINSFEETPLRVAAMRGHGDFVKDILIRKPELAKELDSQRMSPLHWASAKGHVEIVRTLLLVKPDMCFASDRDGRNPLHLAAINGHHQLEALKFLVETGGDHEFVSSKDDDGNTILNLAVADNQTELGYVNSFFRTHKTNVQTIKYLLINNTRLIQDNGIPVLETPAQRGKHMKDIAIGNQCLLEKFLKKQDDWLEKQRSALMVAASLIATMAFQVGVNPPCGVWQESLTSSSQ
ncbi:hypothetical protein RJ640_018791, partial [Escallonia rubra]